MSDSFSKAVCSFHTSDNEDGTFWICIDPEDVPLKLDGRAVQVGLDLKAGISAKQADELADMLVRCVAYVRLWQG